MRVLFLGAAFFAAAPACGDPLILVFDAGPDAALGGSGGGLNLSGSGGLDTIAGSAGAGGTAGQAGSAGMGQAGAGGMGQPDAAVPLDAGADAADASQ